ncbi:hypothetical protein DDZ13_01535 [Coraliomargarita sinensis]|uniref:Uncharacterized protein n=1 Tax=Coraliomargarita sinensis TaxID=2174842 RepID=A0A317ZMW4_9BACT|nr:hypothetical protein [Coraliomargarita sinensis]PXA05583.1 hypothetical protein DDZ13_01535 [Coraliomargarita sinensis]
MNNKKIPLLYLGIVLLGFSLNAQGGFVLFGDAGEAPVPEEKSVRPLTAPYFHEDAFVTTDVRAWYAKHHFYSDTIGGDVTVMAVQVRVALTQRLQLVAYKDGYTEFDDALVLGDNDGFNDIGAGLKWAFLQDWENQFHLAAGLGYEFGWGDDEVLQDTDEFRLWLSANKGFGKLHFGAVVNYIISDDDSEGLAGNSDLITVHLHADYYLTEWFSPVVEINGYFAQDEGVFPFSGVDAVSLGGGDGEDIWTGALGFELRPLGPEFGLRAAYETELSDNVSLFGHRWTLSAVYEF